jgi:hypothetical protein
LLPYALGSIDAVAGRRNSWRKKENDKKQHPERLIIAPSEAGRTG